MLFIQCLPLSECVGAQSLQSCLTLCDPIDCNPPDSSVHGILQARVLERVSMPSSRGSSWWRYWTHVSCGSCIVGKIFTIKIPGKPSAAFSWFNWEQYLLELILWFSGEPHNRYSLLISPSTFFGWRPAFNMVAGGSFHLSHNLFHSTFLCRIHLSFAHHDLI